MEFRDDGTHDLATLEKRFFGALIDGLAMLAICFPIMWLMGIWEYVAAKEDIPAGLMFSFVAIWWAIYFMLNGYLLFTKGQTIGKVVVKTRIVDLEGNVPNFWKIALLRYLFWGMIKNIPLIGKHIIFLEVLFIFNGNRRCLHDHLAGTRVINA